MHYLNCLLKIKYLGLIIVSLIVGASSSAFTWQNSFIAYSGGSGGNPPPGFLAQYDIFYGTVGGNSTPQYWGWTFARYSSGTQKSLHVKTDTIGWVVDERWLNGVTYALSEYYWQDSAFECGRSLVETTSGPYMKAYSVVMD